MKFLASLQSKERGSHGPFWRANFQDHSQSCGLRMMRPAQFRGNLGLAPARRLWNQRNHRSRPLPCTSARAAAHADSSDSSLGQGCSGANQVWEKSLRLAVSSGLLFAAGLLAFARPSAAASPRPPGEQAVSVGLSTEGRQHSVEEHSSQDQQSEAAGLREDCSTSTEERRWHDTGIELGLGGDKPSTSGQAEEVPTIALDFDEARRQYKHTYGKPGSRYEDLFAPLKKDKKINVMESQVLDPAAYDNPEFEVVTAWRTDRLKRLTYTQLWFLIREHKVKQVKFSNDYKTVEVQTTETAPGGARTERVALPYDPDLYHHMAQHGVNILLPDPSHALDTVLFALLYLVWPLVFAVGMFLFVLKLSFAPPDDQDVERLFQGTKLERVNESKARLTFADIAGIDNVKAEVNELVAFLRNPKRFMDLGARSPSGVLLVGGPGTGKTLLARAIAGEAGVPFFSAAGTEFDQMYVGIGAKKVRDIFRQARDAAPCILFIDEFDGIGKQRTASTSDEYANTLNALLTEMDGFEDNTGVIVIAATNRPSVLDGALTRPGRFDRLVELPLPLIDARIAILEVHARDKKMAPDADFHKIARATGGFSGAQLMNLMNVAAINAVQRGAPAVNTDDMFTALEKIENEDLGDALFYEYDPPPPAVRRQVAIYEAARALIGTITPYYDEVAKVVCCPGGLVTGYTRFIPNEEQLESNVVTRAHMEGQLVVALAGRVAERLMLGEANISMAGAGDAKKANMIARTMIYSHGYGRRLGPVGLMGHRTGYLSGDDSDWIATLGSDVAQVAFLEVQDLLTAADAKVAYGLIKNWEPLKAVIEALMEEETISGDQLLQLLEDNNAESFPDPFVAGFGHGQDGNVVYPGSDKPGAEQMGLVRKEDAGPRRTVSPSDSGMHMPYDMPADLPDLISDEIRVLERIQ